MKCVLFLPALALVLPLGAAAGEPANEPTRDAPLVVIDPGHGGRNSGAPGHREGVHEKAVTLAIAQRLAGHLEGRGYRVIMTRSRDRYLTLRERTLLANERRADLFLSIHANASGTGSSAGFETYVLSPRGVSVDSPALRRRGRGYVGVDADVASVLAAVEHSRAQDRAAELGAAVQDRLRGVRGKDRDRGLRQDSMHVLLGATMPAVLVEVGFIDHPVEGAELLDPATQDRIGNAIADAADAVLR